MELNAVKYFNNPLVTILSQRDLVPFIVLDIEENIQTNQDPGGESDSIHPNSTDAVINLEVAREADFGVNDLTFQIRSHLGFILKVGDRVLGYDLKTSVYEENVLSGLNYDIQDVVLVKKDNNKDGKVSKTQK